MELFGIIIPVTGALIYGLMIVVKAILREAHNQQYHKNR